MTEADAIASLTARLDHDAWQADQVAVCKAIGNVDGKENEANAMIEARRSLFGCDDEDADHAGWMDVQPLRLFHLVPFLDGGSVDRDHDELVRMAFVGEEMVNILDGHDGSNNLATYSVVQVDIAALDVDAARGQLDAAPLRGNRLAKVVVTETIAHTRLQIARVEAAVAARSADPKWKQLLVTAPRAAVAAYRAAATRAAPDGARCAAPRCRRSSPRVIRRRATASRSCAPSCSRSSRRCRTANLQGARERGVGRPRRRRHRAALRSLHRQPRRPQPRGGVAPARIQRRRVRRPARAGVHRRDPHARPAPRRRGAARVLAEQPGRAQPRRHRERRRRLHPRRRPVGDEELRRHGQGRVQPRQVHVHRLQVHRDQQGRPHPATTARSSTARSVTTPAPRSATTPRGR